MTADNIRGVVGIEMALRRRAKGCVLGVTAARPFNPWIGKPEIAGTVEEIAEELAFSTWCPTGTSIQTLVTVEGALGHRGRLQDRQDGTRARPRDAVLHGWHRHVWLVMLAVAMLSAVRHRANHLPPVKRARWVRQAAL